MKSPPRAPGSAPAPPRLCSQFDGSDRFLTNCSQVLFYITFTVLTIALVSVHLLPNTELLTSPPGGSHQAGGAGLRSTGGEQGDMVTW